MKAKAQAIADKAAAMSGGDDDRGVKRDREGDDMLPPDAFENPAQRQRTSGFDAPPAEGAAPAAPVVDAPGAVEGPAPITLQTAGHEGRIIGRGGQNIMRMQDQYQVRIQVKKDQGITEVSGAGAEQCAAEIRSIMDAANAALAAGGSGYVVGDAPGQAPAGGGASRIIPCAGVESRIIGKGGQNIRALRERTGAQIKVRNETRDVEITGHPQAVEAAATSSRAATAAATSSRAATAAATARGTPRADTTRVRSTGAISSSRARLTAAAAAAGPPPPARRASPRAGRS